MDSLTGVASGDVRFPHRPPGTAVFFGIAGEGVAGISMLR